MPDTQHIMIPIAPLKRAILASGATFGALAFSAIWWAATMSADVGSLKNDMAYVKDHLSPWPASVQISSQTSK